MAKVYRRVGSLNLLLKELLAKKAYLVESLEDILVYRENTGNTHLKLKETAEGKVRSNIEDLQKQISDLSGEYEGISTNVEQLSNSKTINPFRKIRNAEKRRQLEDSLVRYAHDIRKTKSQLIYLQEHTNQKIEETYRSLVEESPVVKTVIDHNHSLIAGAIGEEKAVGELKNLPDSYHIINDFNYEFKKAVPRSKEGDWIKSIQADHIVIGPAGVFVIETKNWSSESIPSLNLYSPVEQIRRHGYALFILLNGEISASSSYKLLRSAFKHHWGTQKIEVRNILLMVNGMPNKKFQHVNICSIDNLRSYITYFPQILNDDQIKELAGFLLDICGEHKESR